MARIISLPLNHAKLLCVAIFMFLGHAWSVSADEYLQMKRLLKSLNKPAVKIIETEYGEIFDCVDIYKQPAFDHPLLKNYTIPPKPTSPPNRRNSLVSSNASVLDIKLPHGGCPEGTVPIRRVQMQDLLRARSISHFGKKHYLNGSSFNSANDLPSYHHWAKIDTKSGDFYGTSAHINVWKPAVASKDQSSGAQFWLVSGSYRQLNSIEAEWMVNGEIFGDLEPRIFIYWTSDGYKAKRVVSIHFAQVLCQFTKKYP
ncbi:protein neprosin-like [Aristolochia californica]|uniref:protein neprosin-like n=1 Tax=Aristolochia californica TaxID=171875 RepID=UPI0035D98239